jgi:hypothetical protein
MIVSILNILFLKIYRIQREVFSKKLSKAPETGKKIRKIWISGMKRNGLKALK